ncbi:unnamed protein product [Dovyalis caffra]|uniref:Malectin-like domain-containing protein n=1 Tax=Dovyalis caffra TaxID=77055 RepID=A0AAV1R2F9_9ROSI|nr:unnamed protein product [Dovyalis caffra]
MSWVNSLHGHKFSPVKSNWTLPTFDLTPIKPAFVSIDCGSSELYTDKNSIKRTGDNAYSECNHLLDPASDLQFDGNYWATVNTIMYEVVAHEALYTVKGNTTSICVAQTMPNQLPFISALELRSLLPGMYSLDGRIWVPEHRVIMNYVTNLGPEIEITSAVDIPPAAVLKNAIAATSITRSIFMWTELPETQIPNYLATYFSEVAVLNIQKKRSFQVYKNNSPAPKISISPPFGGVSEDWNGGPCLPSPFSWDWIECIFGATPPASALNRTGYGLTGPLQDLIAVDALQTMNLANNKFTGPIPTSISKNNKLTLGLKMFDVFPFLFQGTTALMEMDHLVRLHKDVLQGRTKEKTLPVQDLGYRNKKTNIIDCGSSDSEPYTDENSITWTGDDSYIQTGESQFVKYSSMPYVMTSLRVFPSRKKNCYKINVSDGERVLVRASFYYGDYDFKFSPPVFELQFDGNYWATVNTTSYDIVSYEAVYTVKGNSTSICLAQTMPDQVPFISALELRSLLPAMYSHVAPNYAMFLNLRVAYGANVTIRYPDDPHDRSWKPGHGLLLTDVTSLAPAIDATGAEDNPPSAVLENAITTSSTLEYIILRTKLPEIKVPIYMATYFSEVARLNKTQKRYFQFYINNKPVSKTPISPPFGSVSALYITNTSAYSNTSFSVMATTDSTLPPLINAMELYTLSNALTDGTNKKDG